MEQLQRVQANIPKPPLKGRRGNTAVALLTQPAPSWCLNRLLKLHHKNPADKIVFSTTNDLPIPRSISASTCAAAHTQPGFVVPKGSHKSAAMPGDVCPFPCPVISICFISAQQRERGKRDQILARMRGNRRASEPGIRRRAHSPFLNAAFCTLTLFKYLTLSLCLVKHFFNTQPHAGLQITTTGITATRASRMRPPSLILHEPLVHFSG